MGDFVLAPGTGDYAKRLTVQAYAVSDLLRQGENEITVTLGDGWYRGSVGIDGLRNYYGADLALLCQLEIGGEPALCSDASWQASQQGVLSKPSPPRPQLVWERVHLVSGSASSPSGICDGQAGRREPSQCLSRKAGGETQLNLRGAPVSISHFLPCAEPMPQSCHIAPGIVLPRGA